MTKVVQGCFVSQHNPELIKAMTLLTETHTDTISSLYLSALLLSPQLPALLTLNSERLTASYRILADSLRKWNVDFVQPTHGLFVFARLASKVFTAEQGESCFDILIRAGLKVSPGRLYIGKDNKFGWARIRFSIADQAMRVAVARLDQMLESQR